MLINLVCWFYLLFLFRIFFSSEAKKKHNKCKNFNRKFATKAKEKIYFSKCKSFYFRRHGEVLDGEHVL